MDHYRKLIDGTYYEFNVNSMNLHAGDVATVLVICPGNHNQLQTTWSPVNLPLGDHMVRKFIG
jgi:hypothetical protein